MIVLKSFVAFNVNAISNLIYVLTSNVWMFLLIAGVIGTIFFLLKEEVDTAVREEQNII